MRERILGYDIREMWYEDEYEPVKQGRFKKMLSMSEDLWGSLFGPGSCPDIVGAERERLGLGTVELPELCVVGESTPLWSSLDTMLSYAQSHVAKSGRLYWVVAITIRLEDPERELQEREEWPYYSEPVPDSLQDDWPLIGYDVTNCYSESMIVDVLGPSLETGDGRGCPRDLNPFLLFSSIDEADDFRKELDVMYEDESPHMIYGIWSVRQLRY